MQDYDGRTYVEELRQKIEEQALVIQGLRVALSFYADTDSYYGLSTPRASWVWKIKGELAQSAIDCT